MKNIYAVKNYVRFDDDWEDDLCMKTKCINHHNAITLANGFLWTCDENTLITPVKTHIVIESEG